MEEHKIEGHKDRADMGQKENKTIDMTQQQKDKKEKVEKGKNEIVQTEKEISEKQKLDNTSYHVETNLDRTGKKKKRMPVWGLVITDILLTGIALCVFALFHHVLPQHLSNTGTVVATIDENEVNQFALPDSSESDDSNSSSSNSSNDASSNSNDSTGSNSFGSRQKGGTFGQRSSLGGTNFSNENTTDIASDTSDSTSISSENKTTTKVNNYSSDNLQFTTSKVEIGSGSDKITYYVSDIYVTSVKYLKTAFATGEYGKNLREATADIAQDNNALLAISGDFYGNSEEGVVIRNGVLYRSDVSDTDICVLYTDGTMKTYSPGEFDAEKAIAQGAWQAWSFGPALLDGNGNMLSTFNTTSYINGENPRCAIGYVGKGHYVFVVVDGRDEGYSRGATLSELAQIMADEGCVTAYNLDGGKSAAMVYQDEYVNQPADGGRTISDIIYVGE